MESLQITDPNGAPPLDGIIANVRKTWAYVARIEVDVAESMKASIESDPQLMRALSELIPELFFNSVKRGEATDVSCEVVEAGPDTVTLTCSDNGTRPAQSSRVGLGTKLLDEYALRWDRVAEGGQTITTLVLPISPKTARIDQKEGVRLHGRIVRAGPMFRRSSYPVAKGGHLLVRYPDEVTARRQCCVTRCSGEARYRTGSPPNTSSTPVENPVDQRDDAKQVIVLVSTSLHGNPNR